MSFDVGAARRELPACQRAVYLNAGTFGPMPRVAHAAMAAHNDRTLERGRLGAAGFRAMSEQVTIARAAFASALGVMAEDLALNHSTTDGINTVLWGLSWSAGDEILTTTEEHPGLMAPLEELARRTGVVVRKVAQTAAALSAGYNKKTRLLALAHVNWTTGAVLPLREIAAVARERGVLVLVDGAQSVGHFPLDFVASNADFYTISGQKWLCGPSATGALWVRPGECGSLGTPWPSYSSKQRSPEGARDWGTAQRLDGTTISMTSLDGLTAALGFYASQAAAGAHRYALELATCFRKELAGMAGIAICAIPEGSCLLAFQVPGRPSTDVVAFLESEGVLVRSIPGPTPETRVVRVSIGFWNDVQDMEKLVTALRKLTR